jgi:hypothetical protein
MKRQKSTSYANLMEPNSRARQAPITIGSSAVLWCRRNFDGFWLPFIVLLALHQAYYGTLLIGSNFVPYVMDGNETFSVWWHAHNLYTFSFWKSFGLTDESYGVTEASHPFFHTHQGNMPRLFGFLIYALGARTVEAQVLVTTLVIGNLTLFFCYASIAKVARPAIAFVFCLFLFSDYLLYAQWHVVTYRVWYGFLFFGTLFAISSATRPNIVWPYILLGTLFFLLLYFELVFAVYLSIAAGLYGVWLHWGSPKRIAKLYSIQLIAGLAALGLLFLQNVLAFGFDVVKADFSTTFLARNASSVSTTFESVEAFFRNHNIVFWNNFRDGTLLRTMSEFAKSIGTYIFQVWTPIFYVLVGIPFVGVLISFLETDLKKAALPESRRSSRLLGVRMIASNGASRGVSVNLALESDANFCGSSRLTEIRIEGSVRAGRGISLKIPGLLTQSAFWQKIAYACISILALRAFTAPGALFGIAPDHAALTLWKALASVAVVISLLFLIGGYLTNRSSLMVIGRAVLTVALAAGLITNSHALFNQAYSEIWTPLFQDWKVRLILRAATIAMLVAATGIAASGAVSSFGRAGKSALRGAIVFSFIGFASYASIYLLSPGYVLSGYAERYAPFAIFFVAMVPAVALYALVLAGGRCRSWAGAKLQKLMPVGRVVVPVLAALLVAVPVVLWITVQVYYVGLFPPDHLSFLKTLRSPPFRNATFAVNNYAAPAAYYSGNWAYFDTVIGYGAFARGDSGYNRLTDRSMIWLGDWKSNSDYSRPAFYLCMPARTFASVLFERDPRRLELPFRFCKDAPILKEKLPVPSSLMASDFLPPKFWSIVSLDWHGPKINAVSTAVDLVDGKWVVTSRLDVESDPQHPVTSSKFELLAGPAAKDCTIKEDDLTVIQKSDSSSSFALPTDFRGPFRVRARAGSDVGDSETELGDLWTVRTIPGRLAGTASRCPIVIVDVSFGLDSAPLREKGWSAAEDWGTWTVGPQASLRPIPIPDEAADSDLFLEADIRAFIPKSGQDQKVAVLANGVVVANWVITDAEPERIVTARIPKATLARSSALSLSFDISNPASPSSLGISFDPRALGIGVKRLKIKELER